MKTKTFTKILLSLALVFLLGTAITEVRGDVGGCISIFSIGNVTRGTTGHFTIQTRASFSGFYVNFAISGTAIPGVDYVALVSPIYVPRCLGDCEVYIPVTTLPDPRGLIGLQSYSVDVKLLPGIGYCVGEPSSAKMLIDPSSATATATPAPTLTPTPRATPTPRPR
jgi:hypothetical protein